MEGNEVKRAKVEDLSPENAISLMQWLIEEWDQYNGPVAGGSKKDGGTIKKQKWTKWASQLEALGDPRNCDQVKKKINGELAFVRKRISDEKIETSLTGGGKRKQFPKLSESRQILYEFLSASDSVVSFNGLESGGEPPVKILKIREEMEEDATQLVYEEIQESREDSKIIEANEETKASKRSDVTETTPFRHRIKNANSRPALQDVSELRRQLLLEELETAKIKKMLAQKELENADKIGEKLDIELENVRMKRGLLLNECASKGLQVVGYDE